MSKCPRILMLTTQLGYGGAETSFIRLANFLADSMDVTVALFTADYGAVAYAKGHEALHASMVLLDSPTPQHALRRWWRRIHALRKLKAEHDVTISFLSGPNVVNAMTGRRARSIVSVRGSRRYDPASSRLKHRVFQYVLDPITYHLAGRIVPVSEGLRHEFGARLARSQKIVTIPPFIDPALIADKLKQPIPEAYARLKGHPLIVVVGRLSVEKGVQHMLPIFAEVATKIIGAKLLLVGDGPLAPHLREQCHTLGLAVDDVTPGVGSVIFAGYQANVLPLVVCARVAVLASATEGFPNVLLEAMAAGVPVVANDAPWGARAILQDEASGADPYPTHAPTLTPYGTLMPRIDDTKNRSAWVDILHSRLTQPLGVTDALKRVDAFTLEKIGARWRSLIMEVMGA